MCAYILSIIRHSIKRQISTDYRENMYAQSGEHIEIDGEANRERLI